MPTPCQQGEIPVLAAASPPKAGGRCRSDEARSVPWSSMSRSRREQGAGWDPCGWLSTAERSRSVRSPGRGTPGSWAGGGPVAAAVLPPGCDGLVTWGFRTFPTHFWHPLPAQRSSLLFPILTFHGLSTWKQMRFIFLVVSPKWGFIFGYTSPRASSPPWTCLWRDHRLNQCNFRSQAQEGNSSRAFLPPPMLLHHFRKNLRDDKERFIMAGCLVTLSLCRF